MNQRLQMRRVAWTTAIAGSLALAGLAGCGGLGLGNLLPPGLTQNQAGLVGTWKTVQMTQDSSSTAVACPGTIGSGASAISCEAEIRTYNSDGTWQTTSPSDLAALGSYQINGSLLTVNKNGVLTAGLLTFSPDNNTFYWVVNGITYANARQ